MKRLLLILLCLPMIGFGQTEYKKIYYEKYGTLKSEGNYIDGNEEGFFRYYYNNGTLDCVANWKNGTLDGLRQRWHQNGQLRVEENYKDGKLISGKYWDREGNETERVVTEIPPDSVLWNGWRGIGNQEFRLDQE